MTEKDILRVIEEALEAKMEDGADIDYRDLQAAGFLTRDKGLVILADGQRFILTISER